MGIATELNNQRGVRKSGKNYILNEQLLAEIKKSQEEGAPTVALCVMVRQVHEGVLRHRCFNRYPQTLKEEMASESFYRILRGLVKTYDTTRENAFGYVSHACFLNFMQQIMKRYKRIEREQLAADPSLAAAAANAPGTAKMNGKPLPNLKEE